MTPGRSPRGSASPRSECSRPRTGVQSHSLSQGYRADLPTSLGRVIFSLEVSSLGDLMRLSVRRPPVARSPSWGAPRPGAWVHTPTFWPWRVRLQLGCSTRALALGLRDGQAALTGKQWTERRVAAAGRACGNVGPLPFRRLCGRGRALRTEWPAVCFSGCGILLLVSGR